MKGMVGYKDVVDPDTGEVLKMKMLIIAPQDSDVRFCKIFIPFVEEVIDDPDLVGGAFKLLLWISKNLNWNDLKFIMNPAAVCKELGISRVTYYRWRNILLKKGIIYRDDLYKEVYYLRPYSVVKGSMYKIDKDEMLKNV